MKWGCCNIISIKLNFLNHHFSEYMLFEPKENYPYFVFAQYWVSFVFIDWLFTFFFLFLFIDAVGHLVMVWETFVVSFSSIVRQRLLENSSMYTLACYAEHLKLHVYSLLPSHYISFWLLISSKICISLS